MRRANGSGTVFKLSGKRHKPWVAKVTTGYTDDGKQIIKAIGYYVTKKEAQDALDAYHHHPEELTNMTVSQAWEGWCASYQGSENTIKGYRSAYKRMSCIHNIALRDLNLTLMQQAVDSGDSRTFSTVTFGKKVLSALMEYGFSHDACPASRKELLAYIKVPEKEPVRPAQRFSDEIIQKCIDQHVIGAVILIFTGLRRSELLGLTLNDIDLEEQMIHVRKSKTAAGIRSVPIPDKLIPWMQEYIEAGMIGKSRWVFENRYWKSVTFLQGHTRHECRHTYISLLTEAGVDERLIKALVGHTGGVTVDVYTHYSAETMLQAVNRIADSYLPSIVEDEFVYDRLRA